MQKMTFTIEVPEQYKQWLCDEAARRDSSVEQLVWEAIYVYHKRSQLPRTFHMEAIRSKEHATTMKSTTIEIPDELDDRLSQEATRRGVSVTELVSEILAQHFAARPRVFRSEGMAYSGEGDLSLRVEEILEAEWGDHIDPGGRRSSHRTD